ncbi:MAG: recombinase zinc beta ribbon domain-containing protein, partial [Planctomycetota bacterium]
GFRKMLDDIRSGLLKIDVILVDTIERFARLEDLPAIRDELRKKYGVLILTSDTGFADPTSMVGRIYGAMEAIRASSAAAQKAHDVLRGKIDVVMMKRWPGGPPNCGYRLAARTETITRRSGKTVENVYHVLEPDPASVEIPRRVYQLAYDTGWGRTRIVNALNADPDFVERFGKISESLVGSIMTNTVYKGLFRFNFLATDIEDDCRIIRKKDPDEVIYVEGFCEGIVDAEIVEKVHADVRVRSEKIMELRAARKKADGKQIQPLNVGLILVYPLTGLVRCAICGAAMRPSKSGAKSKDSASYYYYRCPCAGDGRCSNRLYLRGPWLWEVVIARLREVLFPLVSGAGCSCPDWLPELIAEVRSDLIRRLDQDQDRRPMLEKESKDIDGKAAGWTETLSKPDLSSLVRTQIVQHLNVALQRKQEIEAELDMLASGKEHVEEVLDPKAAIDRLCRLDDVLAGTNPSDINVELSRHIESILVHPDGTVVMRTNRLGVFEGVAEILAGDRAVASVLDDVDGEPEGFQIRPRVLSRRRTTGPGETSKLAKSDGLIETPVELPDKWVDETLFHMPKVTSWAKDHAEEVFHRRQEGQLSHAKLAAEFGVSRPTVQAAIRHYLATHPDASDDVDLPRGGQRPPKFDLAKFGHEARSLWEAGWSKLKLAEEFGCSSPTIDKALAWAYEQDGTPMPTRTDRKELRVARTRAMLDEGQSLVEVAETLRVSDVTVRKYLRASFAAEGKVMPDLRSKPRRPR